MSVASDAYSPKPSRNQSGELARSIIGLLMVLATSACDGAPARPSRIGFVGVWGGDHVSLTVSETGSHLEFDCAHGEIPSALTVDTMGTFAAAGTYVREHGGPIRDGELPDAQPATYSGTITGAMMRLSIRLPNSNEAIGSFTLTRDVAGRVVKCL